MSLDRLSIFFVFSLLPILFLPKIGLNIGYVWAGCLFLFALVQKQKGLIYLSVLIGVSYFQVVQITKEVEKVTAYRSDETIQIVQILKQQDYQTAIAKRQNGERIYVTWQTQTPLSLERFYQVNIALRPISSRQNIGNFDRQKWYFAQDIQAIGTVRQAELLLQDERSLRTKWLDRTKETLATFRTQGLLLALAFGERAWLKSSDWQAFQQTATAHLIAISGLHIALAMGVGIILIKGLFWVGGRFGWWQTVRSSPFSAKFFGFAVAVGYSYLAGFAVPTVRALLAISLILLCQYFRRHYTAWQFWWRVVALLLLLDPLALLSDSFWLSVLAVASLILWYQCFPLKRFCTFLTTSSPLWLRFLFSLLHLQIGIWLVFSPVQLLFFQGVSPVALLTNLAIVPLYSLLLVPLILFSLLSDNLFNTWWLADQLAQGSLWFLDNFSDKWQPLNIQQQWQLLSLNLLILLILFILPRFGWKSLKHWRLIGILCLGFHRLPWLWQQFFSPPLVQWLHFDVGQGLAMAFVYEEGDQRKAVLYDTGASWQGGSMAELEILPYLQRQGIDVEAIFISHDDNDHAGGLPSLLSYFPHSRVIASGQASTQQLIEPCEKGKHWQFGGIHFTAIFPEKAVKRAKNADSCVLLAQFGKFKLLLTGDAGREQERQFVPQVGKIDFLQVGHHGSNTSSSHTLLASSRPDWAIISSGRWNPWRLPNRFVEQRLSQYQIATLNTAQVGMVQIDFFATHYQIRTARHPFSPWYRGYFGQQSL